jgi:signal transduction histidine kinase
MKIPRGILIWTTLVLCGVMVLGAMSWLTQGVLASEKERALAEARADLEECTRLALWRIDAAGAALVSGENRHPPEDYQKGALAFQLNTDPLVKLHFELRESGKLTSPETERAQEKLVALRALFGKNPVPSDEWSLLKHAADASETAWSGLPKQAPAAQESNAVQRKSSSRSENRLGKDYQQNFNDTEKALRAKNVEDAVSNTSQAPKSQAIEIEQKNSNLTADTTSPVTNLGAMRAIWIGGELFLLRQFSVVSSQTVEKGVQGVWLDQAILRNRLLAVVKDLLPNSSLLAANDTAQDPLALVSFPLRLHRNETLLLINPDLNISLVVGWIAVLIAILTASLLVHGIMRLSERRASFVSAVTHELRTPLTTFRLYSEMLQSGAVKPEKRGDYLRVLSCEADRLSHLVENVLSFSQIERGSARSVIRESSISGLLEPMRERLEARLASAGMCLQMDTVSELLVRVDSVAVEHILFNLIDNAAKYAARGDPPQVEIRALAEGRNMQIFVSDYGPGILPSERRRIFRAFHKSAHEAAESSPGVGLGLALSRRLAKSLGGSLECIDSQTGACFVLSLPVK